MHGSKARTSDNSQIGHDFDAGVVSVGRGQLHAQLPGLVAAREPPRLHHARSVAPRLQLIRAHHAHAVV